MKLFVLTELVFTFPGDPDDVVLRGVFDDEETVKSYCKNVNFSYSVAELNEYIDEPDRENYFNPAFEAMNF